MRTVVREDIFRVELKIACVAFEESALVDLREIEIELVLFDVSQKITTDFSRLSGLPQGNPLALTCLFKSFANILH